MQCLRKSLGGGWIILLLLVTVALVVSACGRAADPQEPEEPTTPTEPTEPAADEPAEPVTQVIRVPEHEPTGLDPTKGGHGYYASVNMFVTLIDIYTEAGVQKPMAAERWEWSDDGLQLTFYLRQDMLWSDGNQVTAHDFRYAWLRQLDPATAAYGPSAIFPIVNAQAFNRGEVTDREAVGIEAPDDFTLRLTLDYPSPALLQRIGGSRWMAVPEWVVEEHGDRWVFAENIVTCGPYTMESWSHDRQMVLVKDENWWGPEPSIDRIEFLIMEDAWGRGIFAYEAGEVDWAEVPAGELERVRNDPVLSTQAHNVDLMGVVYVNVDNANPPFDDVRVRKAFHMAIDREVLTRDVLAGAYDPAWSIVPPGIMGRNPDNAFGYDPDRARELLAEAGYPDGEGLRDITLVFWSVDRARTCAEAIQAMLKNELNVNLVLQPLEPAAMADYRISVRETSYDLYWGLGWAGVGDPTEFHDQFYSEFSWMRTRFSDPEYDVLTKAAGQEVDPDRRAELYYEAETILNEAVPLIPLFYEGKVHLIQPRVKGLLEATSPLAVTILYYDGVHIEE